MVCFSPMKAYAASSSDHDSGKKGITFSGTKTWNDNRLLHTLPCGGCLGCRMDRANGWAIRCVHESAMYSRDVDGTGSCFVTLTIAPENLLPSNSVRKRSLQLFFKRLRKSGFKVRYINCGEYGDRNGRAHYHALIFGTWFPDRKRSHATRDGHWLYTSEVLEKAWPWGRALIGDVTFQSARYVASYITKKWKGDGADAHYTRVSPVDGEFYRVEPEFASMSMKPGLGESWFAKFETDVFPSDFVVLSDGAKRKPPRYYEKLFVAKHGEKALAAVKRERRRKSLEYDEREKSRSRLSTREECATIKQRRFERSVG